jgi:hydrogenase maturation protease
MSTSRILIGGIGNIFLGDDAFGVEVVQRLAHRRLPQGVRVVDFGIRGVELVYALMEPHDLVILVDAMKHGARPGELHVLEPAQGMWATPELHDLTPAKALAAAAAMGATLKGVLIVGCEPENFGSEDCPQFGLSEPVSAALTEAVRLIEFLVTRHSEAMHA